MSEREVPNFNSYAEAKEFYLSKVFKLKDGQWAMLQLRECLVYEKASRRIDPSKSLAEAIAEDAYVAGQLAMLETLLSSGHVVDADNVTAPKTEG